VLLLLCPKSDLEAEIVALREEDEANDEGYGPLFREAAAGCRCGEFAPPFILKSPMSGGFLAGLPAFRRPKSSEAVSSLLSESELDDIIHLADNRLPSVGCCGRSRGDEDDAIGDPFLGIGEDLPIACGGSKRAGRDGVPFGVDPPTALSFSYAFPPPPVSVLTKLLAIAKPGLLGRARLTCNGTFPGGIESEGCSGTGRCTELRFFADSSCACRNCATVIF
jgi:hypothetical protein